MSCCKYINEIEMAPADCPATVTYDMRSASVFLSFAGLGRIEMYPVRITTPCPDILLNPFECFDLVLQTEIGSSIRGDLISIPDESAAAHSVNGNDR